MDTLKNGGIRGNPCPTPDEYIETDVEAFACAMVRKFRQRREYGYWQGIEWQFYFSRLLEELEELRAEVDKGDFQAISEESIDVANCALMLWINALSMGGTEAHPV